MNEVAIATLLRGQVYALLARGFAEPPPTLADWQAEGRGTEELVAAVEKLPGGRDLAVPLRALAQARATVATDDDLEHLRVESVELFGNLRSQRFPPYETEYTRGGDFRQNQDLADLMGFYHAFGLDLAGADGRRERPDHIAVELEFFQFLCWLEAAARSEAHEEHTSICFDAEQKFLRDHLGRWADLFARGLEKTAASRFYQALAVLLRAWVAQDAATLGVTLDPIAVPPPERGAPEPMTCGEDTPCPLVQIGREQ